MNVKFITSLALAVNVDGEVKHVQITLAQEEESKQLRCFFDVIDPSKIKLADEVPEADNA